LKQLAASILAVAFAANSTIACSKSVNGIAINAASKEALLIIKTEWFPPAPNMRTAFRLALSSYDPVSEKILGAPYGGAAIFEAKSKSFMNGYLVIPVKPGRWVYTGYSQQDKWTLCFNAKSLQFEAKPGDAIYLGEFDSIASRRELTVQAFSTGKFSINSYGFADFFDLPEGPLLKPIDDEQLAAVQEVVHLRLPLVVPPVKAADYLPARFGTGSTLFGERRCGGYFSGSPKGKRASADATGETPASR
jgi:hypothetical protein